MSRTLTLWAMLAAFVPLTFAQDPAPPEIKPGLAPVDSVRLPDVVVEQPPVVTATGANIRLTTDLNIYVFDADVEVIATTSPPGLLRLTKIDGPIRIRDRFADNPSGRNTTRYFKGKYVFEVTAVAGKSGTAELLVLPTGAKAAVELRRRVFDVNSNLPPVPPTPPGPNPPTPPAPQPTDTSPFPADANRVLIVYENSTPLPAAQQSVLFGEAVRNYLDTHTTVRAEDNTPERRIWDQNVKGLEFETPVWRNAMARPRKSIPWILVGNARGQGFEGPLPGDETATLALLKKYLGE